MAVMVVDEFGVAWEAWFVNLGAEDQSFWIEIRIRMLRDYKQDHEEKNTRTCYFLKRKWIPRNIEQVNYEPVAQFRSHNSKLRGNRNRRIADTLAR